MEVDDDEELFLISDIVDHRSWVWGRDVGTWLVRGEEYDVESQENALTVIEIVHTK